MNASARFSHKPCINHACIHDTKFQDEADLVRFTETWWWHINILLYIKHKDNKTPRQRLTQASESRILDIVLAATEPLMSKR